MKLRPNHHRQGSITATTMADIAFLLIIFFMLASSFTKEKISVDLPSSFSRQEIPPGSIIISMKSDGKLFWNSKKISIENILNSAKLEIRKNEAKYFLIKADRRVHFKFINNLIQNLRRAGVRNICLPTKLKNNI